MPERPTGPRCGRCAARLAPMLPEGELCPDCRDEPPGFDEVVALADYQRDAGAREWILALKHGGRADLAPILGAALARLLAERGPGERALLVPVPLHLARRIERGYDQAWLLARAIGRTSGTPCARVLRRTRATPSQGAPGSRSRRANVRDAFALRPFARRRLARARVWLVDDVVTSGATAGECARVLRRGGAARVGVVCLARAGEGGA